MTEPQKIGYRIGKNGNMTEPVFPASVLGDCKGAGQPTRSMNHTTDARLIGNGR